MALSPTKKWPNKKLDVRIKLKIMLLNRIQRGLKGDAAQASQGRVFPAPTKTASANF